MPRNRGHHHRRLAAVLWGTAVLLWSATAAAADLGSLRATQRAALKTTAEAGDVQRFRLLVVPVDFSDARLGDDLDWDDVSGRLAGEGESLERYFAAASNGRMRMTTVLAPLVRLVGDRRSYSDRDLGGDAVRSRAMATEALAATAPRVPFALVDGDGPDGTPGSADDDGFVDGVLILHAAPGLENDLENGLIIPLQYWLEEPVVDRGVTARSYAVASLHSGLGMWLHETAHLLGLEDRYDLFLRPPSVDGFDVQADVGWGGLGMFSLMGAGHLGSGDGVGAALLDAYSAVQLGWIDVATLRGDSDGVEVLGSNPGASTAWRIDVPGAEGREYFLLESRGDAAPFDAAVPSGKLMIYHVDENVPEDGQSTSNPAGRHLRVRLVEADGDDDVASALTLGDSGDLFPADDVSGEWTPSSTPASNGYHVATGASLTSIASARGGVGAAWTVPATAVSLDGTISESTAQPGSYGFMAETTILGDEAGNVIMRLDAPAGGGFDVGDEILVDLVAGGTPGTWSLPYPVSWIPESTAPGTIWSFDLQLSVDGEVVHDHRWSTTTPGAPDLLDFSDDDIWLRWTAGTLGTPSTAWKRWDADGGIAPAGERILALTRSDALPADWPAVTYDNGADSWLLSPLLQPGAGFAMTYHLDTAGVVDGVGPDGAVVEAVLYDGTVVPLEPLLGHPGGIVGWSSGALRGRDGFVGEGELAEDERPYWDVAVFDTSDLVGGDIRLRFRFAADALWRGRGWFIRSLIPVNAAEGFRLEPVAAGWRPNWPDPTALQPGELRSLEARVGGAAAWERVAVDADAAFIDRGAVIAALDQPGVSYWELRLVQSSPLVLLRSRAVGLAPRISVAAAGNALTLWPNPARSGASVQLDLAEFVQGGVLDLYDLRGRRLRSWTVGPGVRIVEWDGRDASNRGLPAGRYFLRLKARDITETRSLTLIP